MSEYLYGPFCAHKDTHRDNCSLAVNRYNEIQPALSELTDELLLLPLLVYLACAAHELPAAIFNFTSLEQSSNRI